MLNLNKEYQAKPVFYALTAPVIGGIQIFIIRSLLYLVLLSSVLLIVYMISCRRKVNTILNVVLGVLFFGSLSAIVFYLIAILPGG